jgi:hypothetical protein
MDDILVVCPSYRKAVLARAQVEEVLLDLGLSRHPDKGQWEISQKILHLGMEIDLKEGKFRAPEGRMVQLNRQSASLIGRALRNRRLIPARQLARFTGLCQFLYLAIPVAKLYLRSLYDCLRSKTDWNSNVRLSKQAIRDLEWWQTMPTKWNGRDIARSPSTVHLHSDASTFAWGGVLNYNEASPARGCWTTFEKQYHITILELLAVHKNILTFLPQLRNCRVCLHEDNQAVMYILREKTSRSQLIMKLLRRLWRVVDLNSIDLEIVYVRSEDNISDGPSRTRDFEDWQISPAIFEHYRSLHRYTIDLFASENTALLPRFCSADLCPGTLRADAFSWPWAGEVAWVNPPWSELDRVVQMLREVPSVSATVVVPWWPQESWFQGLLELTAEWELLPVSADLVPMPHPGVRRLVGSSTRQLGLFHVRLA